jgi:hypothetical protein
MTDRERRIVRARARLAVAAGVLEQALPDVSVIGPDLERRVERSVRSIRWVVKELEREEGRADGG